MGAETCYTNRPLTPSRISNCGEMVAEEVVRQMEEELRQEAALRSCARLHSAAPAGGGRKLLVGLKLSTSCRAMLSWTIATLAQPGDHVLALHVSSLPPSHSGASPKEKAAHLQQLANTLHGILSVYKDLCELKQIKLQVEIVEGAEAKKVLVEVAKCYNACKLILGTNKHFTVGRTTALGKYCLKCLPCTCTVVVLEHGQIIFNKKGKLSKDMTRPGMLKALRRSMRSVGRGKKVVHGSGLEELDEPTRPSVVLQLTFTEFPRNRQSSLWYTDHCCEDLDRSFGSSSSLFHEDFATSPISVLLPERRDSSASGSEALRMSFSNRRKQGALTGTELSMPDVAVERADMFLLQDQQDDDAYDQPSPAAPAVVTSLEASATHAADSGIEDVGLLEDVLIPGWPLLHHTIGFDKKKPVPSLVDRDLSVVNWALQLPAKSKKDQRNERMVGETTPGAIGWAEAAAAAPSGGGANAVADHGGADHVRFSIDFTIARMRSRDVLFEGDGLSLAQQVDCLCLDRRCTAFSYAELDAATCHFAPSNVVGRGGGSEVFRGAMRGGKVVAVKRLNRGPQAEEELLTDIEINTSLSHAHIMPLLGYCVESPHLILVYDYLLEGNLEEHLHAVGKEAPVLPWAVRHKVAVGIAKALDYLHDGCARPVIHRDVKASNILLTASFESQLSDFGLAKWAPTNASHIRCNDVVGTFGYLAPEYFMYGRLSDKTDVYAFGVVLLELITGRTPIDTTRPKGQENLVIWAKPLLQEEWSLDKLVDRKLEGIYDVAQMKTMAQAASLCVRQSAQRRPRISQILQLLCGEIRGSAWAKQHEETSSVDLAEFDSSSPDCGGEADVQTAHLALAMLGVDDDAASQGSVDHSSVDIPHSSAYLAEYLEGRFSRSASFEN